MTTQIRLRARMLQSRSAARFALVLMIKLVLLVAVNFAAVLPLELTLGLKSTAAENTVKIAAAALLLLLSIFVFCSSSSGSVSFFSYSALSGEARLKNFFFNFRPSMAAKSAGLNLLLIFLRLAMLFIAFLPSAVPGALLFFLSKDGLPTETVAILFCFFLLMLCVSAFFFKKMSSLLFLSPYLFSSGRGIAKSIRGSIEIMSKNLLQYKKMKRGFYGWFLLCVLVLPVLFVWGYYRQSTAIFAQCLIYNNNLDREEQE